MTTPNRSLIRTGSAAALAFAVVVLASYFAMFSALTQASLPEIGLLMVLGIAYMVIGIYGYAICVRRNFIPLHLAYFAVQILLGGWIVYLGKGAGFNGLLLLPLAGHAVILLSQRWAYQVITAIVLAYVAAIGLYEHSLAAVWAGLPVFLAGLIFIMVFTQMAVSEEKARNQVEHLVEELGGANRRLRAYALKVEELAVTEERNRLAREIHDGLGHYLTTIHVQIQAARALLPQANPPAQEALRKAQEQTQEALLDVRRSVAALRAQADEGLPLPDILGKMLDACRASGIEPQLKLSGEPRELAPQVHLTLYRAAQEGINNIRKHSQASRMWLELSYEDPHQVCLSIRDDGVGAENVETGGFGLIGLRERIQFLEGSLNIQTNPGSGFCVEIQVPG